MLGVDGRPRECSPRPCSRRFRRAPKRHINRGGARRQGASSGKSVRGADIADWRSALHSSFGAFRALQQLIGIDADRPRDGDELSGVEQAFAPSSKSRQIPRAG